jgi:CHAD domain-containing protein
LSFCFHVDESIAKGTKRIARTQMDRALDQLSQADQHVPEEAMHDARRRFKRIRALLRLVRKSLGKRRYNKENACFRDAGRPLTEVRDAQVLVMTFEKLTRRFRDQLSGQPFAKVRRALLRRQKAITKRVFDEEAAPATVVATIKAARRRVKKWTFTKGERSTLHAGLRKTYKRGLESFSIVRTERTTENLHAWRKRAKDLWHELRLLERIWPAITSELVKKAHTLGDYLGDDHDLAVLRDLLEDDSFKRGHRTAIAALLPLIERRRLTLEQAALRLGQKVYGDKPNDFLLRLEGKRRPRS